MRLIKYVPFNKIDATEFLPLLNKQSTRMHLITHEVFDFESAQAWIQSKIDVNSCEGCKVKAITIDNQLAGWCGIQKEDDNYEIAVVIDEQYWGIGKQVFKELMIWAKELGHTTVFIHFLHTRPNISFYA